MQDFIIRRKTVGLSLMSALMIQGNEVECVAMGPFDDGKYGGVIYLMKNGRVHTPIVSVDYGYYKTCKDAVELLEAFVKEVRAADLSPQKKEINDSIGDAAPIMHEIVKRSKKNEESD